MQAKTIPKIEFEDVNDTAPGIVSEVSQLNNLRVINPATLAEMQMQMQL